MNNIDSAEVKEAWNSVTSSLKISDERLISDIAALAEIWPIQVGKEGMI